MTDGSEPHDHITLAGLHAQTVYSGDRVGGVYPGYGDRVVPGRAIPVPRPIPSQDPNLTIFQPQGPTHGQMRAILRYSMRFPR